MLIVLGAAVASIAVGTGLYYFGPEEFRTVPASQTSEASALSADATTNVPFSVIAEGANAANVSARKNYAVYDQEEFARLWAMAYGEDGPAMPAVDFDKDYVIGVFAGEKATGGYDIAVDKVTDENGVRAISIVLTTPGSACMTTQALTSPFELVTVPFSSRELTRTETQVEGACS